MSRRTLAPFALLLLSACERYGRGYYHSGIPWALHLSIFGTLIALADLWACYHIWRGPRGLVSKLLWTLLVWCFPFGGLAIFFMFGDQRVVS